jgi:activating signal cointegrator 1
MKIKCISLWQIWASAMARNLKKNETRGWPTAYRGPLAIHAAKKKFKPEEYGEDWVEEIGALGLLDGIVYGCVLCIIDLKHCRPSGREKPFLSHVEEILGNYEGRRYVWVTDNLRVLPEPIPLQGHQGLFDWEVPTELEHLIVVPQLQLEAHA